MKQIRDQLQEQNQSIIYNDAVLAYIAEHGFSETMGARPMKRLINEQVRLPIAKAIIRDGKNTHILDVVNRELVIA